MDETKSRQRYDRAFKEGAVLLIIEGGKTVSETARDLGISENMLGRGKVKYFSREKESQTK